MQAGVCLLDPTQSIPDATRFLRSMRDSGYVGMSFYTYPTHCCAFLFLSYISYVSGVRFNPYLWPEGESMSDEKVMCASISYILHDIISSCIIIISY